MSAKYYGEECRIYYPDAVRGGCPLSSLGVRGLPFLSLQKAYSPVENAYTPS